MRRPGRREVGHARAGIDVDRLVGGGQVLVRRRALAELHGGRAPPRSPSASWTSRRDWVAEPQPLGAQPQAGQRPRRMACSAAAAAVTPRAQPQHGSCALCSATLWRAFSVASAARDWCCSFDIPGPSTFQVSRLACDGEANERCRMQRPAQARETSTNVKATVYQQWLALLHSLISQRIPRLGRGPEEVRGLR